ncbi:MAG TPA: hypothetical protein VJK29_13690 [Terriglobales bacterium]|jgi:hypothetical protein|nr:hypothetical protein [Terriglobales bacterium]
MVRKPIALFVLAVCLVTVSCKKLGEPLKPTGPLTFETVKFTDAIPQDYGPLIGVTQNPEAPGWAGLWFQRSDGTITAVFVNVDQGKMYQRALTIPRK